MARELVVNNVTFNYPEPGEDPGWGGEATDWAEEVTDVLNSLLGAGDILETTFNVANNVSVAANVIGLAFTATAVRAAVIEYSIYRTTDSSTSGNAETGMMNIVYDNNASSGNKWLLSRMQDGESGVVFDITDGGQFTYTSSNIAGANYSGVMHFKSRTLAQ